MAVFDECRPLIEAAIGRTLSDREIGATIRHARKLKARIDYANGDKNAAKTILDNFVDEREAEKAAKRQMASANALALTKQLAGLDSSEFVRQAPGEALRGKFVGSQKDYFGGHASLGVNISRESAQRMVDYIAELKDAGLMDYAYSKGDAKNMWLAKAALEDGKDATQYGPKAAQWAEIAKRHQDALYNDERAEGIQKGRIESYVNGQTHDPAKLAKAGDNDYGSQASRMHWISKIMPVLNWEKSFGGELINATDAQRQERLGEVWSQFKAGEHLKWGAKSALKSRELIFNSPENAFDYHQEFGDGRSIGEGTMVQLGRNGRNLAIAKEWGPGAESNIAKYIDAVKEKYVGDDEKLEQLKVASEKVNRVYLPSLMGHLTDPGGSGVAVWIANARAFLTTTKIAASLPAMIGDIPLAAARMTRYGSADNMLTSLFKNSMDMFTGLRPEERVQLAKANGIMLNQLGMPLMEGMRDYTGTGVTGTINQAILKWGRHNAWSDRIRNNMLARTGFEHWSDRAKSFDQLSEGRRAGFRQFGITPEDWDIIRSQDGMEIQKFDRVFTADGVRNLSLDSFRKMAPENASDAQLRALRNSIADKYRNFMGEMAERVTTAPSEEMNAIIRLGTKPGTALGEAARAFNELKGFTYNYTRNALGGELLGRNADPHQVGWGAALKAVIKLRNTSGAVGFLRLAAASVGFAYISNTLRDIVDGKSIEDPTQHPANVIGRAFMRQSLGIAMDAFSSAAGKPNPDIWDTIGGLFGPTAETVGDLVDDIMKTFGHGDKWAFNKSYTDAKFYKDFSRDMGRFADLGYNVVPMHNLLFSKAASDYFIHNSMMEMFNPGYTDRLKKRMMKDRGQHYILGDIQ